MTTTTTTMTTVQHNSTNTKPKTTSMQPFRCDCGIVFGWTDGKMLAVGDVSFDKIVTGKCAGCGNHKTWRPCKDKAA